MKWLTILLTLLTAPALAQHSHGPKHRQSDCVALSCAAAATPAFGPDGTLWLAWSAGGQVWVARSGDRGHSFSAPVPVSGAPATIDDNGEARPKLAVTKDRIAVVYALRRDKAYNGKVMLATSTDGRSFAPPRPVTADGTSQRFEALAFTPSGELVIGWTDKRGQAAAKKAGTPYAGAALAIAWSHDGGATLADARIVQDHACECCRLGLVAGEGRAVVMWRQVFAGGIRDHAIATLTRDGAAGPPRRVSVDDWKIDACPHHGPSLALGPGGSLHAAWFTEGRARQGLFLARSTDDGATFSPPRPMGNAERQPSHPQVLAAGGQVWAVWKEFDGARTTIAGMVSGDDGATWSAPRGLAATSDASDHPQLVGDGSHVYLSWLTRADGYRLMALEVAP